MTTTVIVKAHCSPDKEVRITRTDPEEVTILQDGETFEQVVYDERTISVTEFLKTTPGREPDVDAE